jgi:hypothetical protein
MLIFSILRFEMLRGKPSIKGVGRAVNIKINWIFIKPEPIALLDWGDFTPCNARILVNAFIAMKNLKHS